MSVTPLAPEQLREACFLIVDDEEANVRLLTRILTRAGYTRIYSTLDPREAFQLFLELKPDLVMLDVRMPGLDGVGVLNQLRPQIPATEFLPILAITGDSSSETRQRVLTAGARDFLEKPFETSEVLVRVANLLTTRMLHRSLQDQNQLLEHKVRERTSELETAVAAAEAASLAKSQFLATMSHELRTPLNAVIGFAQQLQKNRAGNLQPRDLEFVGRIADNGTHLLRVINDILDLSRIEAGKASIETRRVELDTLVRETVDQSVAALPRQSRVSARVSLPAELTAIDTDESKLRRVLINLIANAAKFTQQGEFVVGVRARDQRPIRIDVLDTGIGIPGERLGAIFDRFEQADNSTQRRFGGTGLGLAISRTLCELMQYRLTVVSEVGTGSCFSILLDQTLEPPGSYAEIASTYGVKPALCA